MDDGTTYEWVVIVPPMRPVVADGLWQEWLSRNDCDPSPEDVLVDCIHATGGDLRSYRIKGVAPMSSYDLANALGARCHIAHAIVSEHLEEWNGEVLVTLLVADVRRHLETGFEAGRDSGACTCPELMDAAIRGGDASVQNAVAVCFVEDSCWSDPSRQPFIKSWPAALRSEIEYQRTWQPSILGPSRRGRGPRDWLRRIASRTGRR